MMNMVFKRISSFLLGTTVFLYPAYGSEVELSGPALDIGATGIISKAGHVSADGLVIAGSYGNRAAMWNSNDMEPILLAVPGGGNSLVNAISANGTYIVGHAVINGKAHAMLWRGNTMGTDLNTLGGVTSNALAVSADGGVIVGYAATSAGHQHAAKWLEGQTLAIDLGTLGGTKSTARAVSADGSVIVGEATLESGFFRAVSWVNGSTAAINLGTLGEGESYAKIVSANGRVIAGQSDTILGERHAVSWTDGATTPTDLGTLGGNFSDIVTISADGSVLAGISQTATGLNHAVSWRNSATTPTDLGTMGGLESSVTSMSADGSIIVGWADTTARKMHAVFWAAGVSGPVDLGTLGGATSIAKAISADGTVVVGSAFLETGEEHATIWKLLLPAPPSVTPIPNPDTPISPTEPIGNPVTSPEPDEQTGTIDVPPTQGLAPEEPKQGELPISLPQPVAVDVTNTVKTVGQLANDTFSVIESQRRGLGRLQNSCDVAKAGESCYSVSVDVGQAGDTTDALGWITAAHAFTDNFLAGLTVAHSVSRDLPGDFDRNNNNIGGGIHAQWKDKTASGNWYLRGAIAANRYDVTRTRRLLGYTEPGTGESTITGWGGSLELGQSFDLKHQATIGYYGGLRYSNLKMDGYAESSAYFPFHYSDVKSERTTAYLSANYTMALAEKMRWSVNTEIEQDLAYKDPNITAYADYIGGLKFEADAAHTRGSVSTTLSYRFSDAVNIGATPYAARTVNRQTAYGTVIDVSGKF